MIPKVVSLVLLAFSLSSNASLVGRSIDPASGTDVDAYYDTELDITWLADANYASTSGFDQDGMMTWDDTQQWISFLNDSSHLGIQHWRLPEIIDLGQNGCVFAFSNSDCGWNVELGTGEMAHLFYASLENLGRYDKFGSRTGVSGLQNSGPFLNIQQGSYWSGTEQVLDSYAWIFEFEGGKQAAQPKSQVGFAWAVVDGDPLVATPLPAAFWLFASALGLIAFLRRKPN